MTQVLGIQPTPVGEQTKDAQQCRDALAQYVMSEWQVSEFDRTSPGSNGYSVEQRLLRCLRAVRRRYNPEDRELADANANVYLGIISQKARALKAWIKDVLAVATFTLEPTPLPDIPESQKDQVIQRLKRELIAMMQQSGTPLPPEQSAQFLNMAKKLKDSAIKYSFEIAKKAAKRAERKIKDQLTQGEFFGAMDDLLDDMSTFPFVIMHGPCDINVRQIVWRGNKAVDAEVQALHCSRVSPFDFYWSTDSTDTQNGRWIMHRSRNTTATIYSFIGLEGVDDEAVREVIQTYGKSGWSIQEFMDAERERLEDKTSFSTSMKLIDVLKFHGKVPGSYLQQRGIEVDDPDRQYECEVWVTAGITLRCVFNAYPLGVRPYHKACYNDISGSFVGEGLPEVLEDIQRAANASLRALVKNMAFASGPMGEVDVERLADGESIDEMEPYRMIQSKTDSFGNATSPAVRFHRFPSVANEMVGLMKYFGQLADEHSGIPAYIMGQTQVGGAGRTLGGLSMLMSNASKGVKMVISNLDKGIVEPIPKIAYNNILLYDPDESLKSDAQVVVRGASGVLERELSQGRATELLQTLAPFAGQMDPANPPVPSESIRELLREITETMGLDVVPDPTDGVQYEFAQLGLQSPQAATMAPPLDGRSTSQMQAG